MSSSFSDKPFPPSREAKHVEEPLDLAPSLQREPGMRLNFRRLLAGFALLFLLTGVLLLCFIEGGLVNQRHGGFGARYIELGDPGHIVGFVFLGLGAVVFVFLFSLEKRQ